MPRVLTNREITAIGEFLDEIADQLLIARNAANRARDGRADIASVELDFSISALDEIADVVKILRPYLIRLSTSAANVATYAGGTGLAPPARHVYTIPDDPAGDSEGAEEVHDAVA